MATAGTKTIKRKSNGAPHADNVNHGVSMAPSVTAALSRGERRKKDTGYRAAQFLIEAGLGKTTLERPKGATIFSQGDAADTIFYIQKGKIKISVVSEQGKEATVAILGPGDFVGEDCIATTHSHRLLSATAWADCVLLAIGKKEMVRALSHDHAFSDVFVTFLFAQNARSQKDLIDQLFNSSEKRLARVLLQLAQFGKEDQPEIVIPKISQEALAEMVGTTRSRISFYMNRFRKLGFIEYDGKIKVHSSLLNVVLHE